MGEGQNKVGCLTVVFHTVMTVATGGFWLVLLVIWALLKYVTNNRR